MRHLNDRPLHRRFLYFTFTSSTTLKPQGARVEVSGQDCLSIGRALPHHDIAIMIVRRLIWRIGLCPRGVRRYVELDRPKVVHDLEDAHCAGLIHCRAQRHVSDAFTDPVRVTTSCVCKGVTYIRRPWQR
jgi:hypothetical protein